MYGQTIDSDQGLRADWMRGKYGLVWKVDGVENGGAEDDGLTIEYFLEQLENLKNIGFI